MTPSVHRLHHQGHSSKSLRVQVHNTFLLNPSKVLHPLCTFIQFLARLRDSCGHIPVKGERTKRLLISLLAAAFLSLINIFSCILTIAISRGKLSAGLRAVYPYHIHMCVYVYTVCLLTLRIDPRVLLFHQATFSALVGLFSKKRDRRF